MRTSRRFSSVPFVLVFWWAAILANAADEPASGEQIYQRLCAKCHGKQGEGVKEHYPEPLRGQRPFEELVKIISDTMPEDDPGSCAGDDARKVAEYIVAAFYSRAEPEETPRIAPARLTVRQYAHAVADLLGTYLGPGSLDDRRGLQGRYFNDKGLRGDKLALERVDGQVDFNFADQSPLPDKIDSKEFAIQWQGSVIAEETGDYEFIVKTDNGARLWVNDHEKPLIDAWVKSGDESEFRGSIRLLGGRGYHLRLDYFKSQDKTASITLQWQPPRRARQTIAQRNLSPARSPLSFVLRTPFPPDDSSHGYERGISVSREWEEAQMRAALEVTRFVVENADHLVGTKEDAADRGSRCREFGQRFVERAFRRPLNAEQRAFYVDCHFDQLPPSAALRDVILLALMSPKFLYAELDDGSLDDYDVATRLAFGLWDSLPDAQLIEAAAQGKLRTREELAGQAQRMLADARTKTKLREFLHKWLQVERVVDISKDKELFPDFDPLLVSDLQTSLDLFLDDVVWGERSDFRQLILADYLFLNDRLATFYGIEPAGDNRFHKVTAQSVPRAGVLTHPCLLTGFAYHKVSSPIHRGVFIVRSLLGRTLKAPPIAVAPLDEGLQPDMTTRERVAFQTSATACQSCHELINPLGFALEHYDAVGRFRDQEKSKPIDASGSYVPTAGQAIQFRGARELAEYLAQSAEVQRGFVRQLFHHTMKQPVNAYGADHLEQLVKHFQENEFAVPGLLVDILSSSALFTNLPEGQP
jgi:cytochrome c553